MQAFRVRRELTDAVNGVLGRYDALLTASALAVAPRFDAVPDPNRPPRADADHPVQRHRPPGDERAHRQGRSGLPLSLQIVGRPFDEATVFRVGRAIETATGWDGSAGNPP